MKSPFRHRALTAAAVLAAVTSSLGCAAEPPGRGAPGDDEPIRFEIPDAGPIPWTDGGELETQAINWNPSCGLNDPEANAARLQIIKDSLACAASALCAIAGGITRPTPPDAIPGFPTPTGDIAAGSTQGDLCAIAAHAMLAVMFEDPNLLANGFEPALSLLIRQLEARGFNVGVAGTTGGYLSIASTLYECGVTILNGTLQLAADIRCLLDELAALEQSNLDVQRMCANYDGYVSCNRMCRDSPSLIRNYWIRVPCTNPAPVPSEDAVIGALGVAIGRRCRQVYCEAGVAGQVTSQGQCGFDGRWFEQVIGMSLSDWISNQCTAAPAPPPGPVPVAVACADGAPDGGCVVVRDDGEAVASGPWDAGVPAL